MRGIRVILILVAIAGLLLIACASPVNAAIAKPAMARAAPACQMSGVMPAVASGLSLEASEAGYPYTIYASGVRLSSTTVGDNTVALDVCLEWENPSAILYLKIFDPAGNPVLFELSDGKIVNEAGDADDGVIDHKIHFIVTGEGGSNLMQGDWYFEVRSDARSATTNYRI